MLTGKKGHMESGPGFPYANLAQAIDVWDGDQQRLADEVCPRALNYLETYARQRFFMFHHLSDPDTMGHSYGEGSEQYAEAIRTCDRCLGEMLKTLHRNGILDRTVVYITADHGFDESSAPYPINPEKPGYSHIQAPYIFLASSDGSQPLVRVGLQRDVAPLMLERLGLPLSVDGIPPLPGASMTRPMPPW
jgi:predicted AlkP superfamily pyrophosphatase or phosphodiesterase